MPKHLIAPSILSADLARLGEEVTQVLEAGADLIHIDVMDNHYVPNLTFGPLICKALRNYGIKAPLDVHLMVEPVDDLIIQFAHSGANFISFHPEASKHVDRSLQLIKQQGCKAGLALNPATPLSVLDHVLDKLDYVLIMSVNPGFSGQSFIESTLEKLILLKEYLHKHKSHLTIAIDGGVNTDNIGLLAKQGVSWFVAGSAIFGSDDYHLTLKTMRQALGEH